MNTGTADSIEEIIEEILKTARTIAVVGLSGSSSRPSYGVAQTLIAQGYQVIGVNPNVDEVPGITCYPRLSAIPEKIDLVDVFRRPDALEPIIEEIIQLHIPYLWLQEGVVNEAAADRAREAGIKVVMDRCMAKELMKREI